MNYRTQGSWAEILFFFGALLLGAAVGCAAFLFAIDKYVAVLPIAVPVEIPCQQTPPPPSTGRTVPKLHI